MHAALGVDRPQQQGQRISLVVIGRREAAGPHGSDDRLLARVALAVGIFDTLNAGAARADAVVALRAATLPRAGLSLTAAATLARLQRSGPARLTELASAEGVSQPSMTALIARLADQGLVRRAADPHDGRAVVLSLTPAGGVVRAHRRAERTRQITGPLAGLSDDDVRHFADALPALIRLADALRRPPVPLEVSR